MSTDKNETDCPECNATGRIGAGECSNCRGIGYTTPAANHITELPADVKAGETYTFDPALLDDPQPAEPTIDWLVDYIATQHSPLIDFNIERLKALIAQERHTAVEAFAERLKRTDILAGLPAESTTVVLLGDIDAALEEYHNE